LNTVIKQPGQKVTGFEREGYQGVYSLVEHPEDTNDYRPVSKLIYSFLKKKGWVGSLWKKEEDLLIQEISRLIRKILVNAIEISWKELKLDSKLEQVETVDVEDTGGGLYLTFRFLNHSCAPNVGSGYFNGSSIMVKAVRDINEGEELFICYGAHHKWQTRTARQKLLKESYFFDCACEACCKDLQPVNLAFICPKCKGPVINENGHVICLKCGGKDHLNLQVLLADARPCFKWVDLGVKCMETGGDDQLMIAEKTFSEAYNLLATFLYPIHQELCKIMDKQRLCYTLRGSWDKAIKCAEKHYSMVKGRTDHSDLATLNSVLKLVHLMKLHAPKHDKLEKFIKEAKELRDLFLHPSSSIYGEVTAQLL